MEATASFKSCLSCCLFSLSPWSLHLPLSLLSTVLDIIWETFKEELFFKSPLQEEGYCLLPRDIKLCIDEVLENLWVSFTQVAFVSEEGFSVHSEALVLTVLDGEKKKLNGSECWVGFFFFFGDALQVAFVLRSSFKFSFIFFYPPEWRMQITFNTSIVWFIFWTGATVGLYRTLSAVRNEFKWSFFCFFFFLFLSTIVACRIVVCTGLAITRMYERPKP